MFDMTKINRHSDDWYAMCLSIDVLKIMRNFDVKYPSDIEKIIDNTNVKDFKQLCTTLKMLDNGVNFDIDFKLLDKWCKEEQVMYKFCLKHWRRLKRQIQKCHTPKWFFVRCDDNTFRDL